MIDLGMRTGQLSRGLNHLAGAQGDAQRPFLLGDNGTFAVAAKALRNQMKVVVMGGFASEAEAKANVEALRITHALYDPLRGPMHDQFWIVRRTFGAAVAERQRQCRARWP